MTPPPLGIGLGLPWRRKLKLTMEPWVRPADWLPLSAPAPGSQIFQGLLAVLDNDSNYVALLVNGSTDYTVDWGDGTITNHTANTKAQHKYTYSTIPSSTESTRGYRQVIVTVTMQSGGNMTTFNLNQRHDRFTANTNIPWLDFNLNSPTVTSITIGGTTVTNGWLERAGIYEVGTITSAASMFASCYSLQTVPLFNTASVTSMSSMFINCYSLQSVPLFNTASVTSMSSMFNNCLSLQSVPLFNTASVTSMSSMFASCYSLQTVPLFNTASVTNMLTMFINCYSLQSVPLFNTASVTNMSSMFNSCLSLQSVPLFNTASVTSMSSMFSNCYSLQSVPLFNTASVTNMSSMFINCFSLQSVPLFNTASVTNMQQMLRNCLSLERVSALNMSAVTTGNFADIFAASRSVSRCEAFGATFSISFVNCKLNRAEIVEIFTNLGTASGAQNVTVTGNHGVADLTPTDELIATNKGWTVIKV